MVAFLVDDVVFTGDTLFKDAVGGGDLEQVRSSVMDVFMALPDETRVLPGHTDETTIGREREANPFVRVWSGAEPEGTEAVEVGGREATLIVWSPDYDGKGKAWVRFDDGDRRHRRRLPRHEKRCLTPLRGVRHHLSEKDSRLERCACSSPAAKCATPVA